MERLTYFERYRITVDADGQPRDKGRCGAAITYKAVDLETGDPVALKIVRVDPSEISAREELEKRARAAHHVEHVNVARLLSFAADVDELVLVSELPAGETVAAWVATHGPMMPDATLRVALQVVSALSAAAFHGLTHAAIEPANLLVVPGVAPDGGWPFIKLLNLDVAGTRAPVGSGELAQLPAAAPQFAAPEQLASGTTNFPAEIYSLGATMAFMLTGIAPLASVGTEQQGELARRMKRLPRQLRNLLGHMLQADPAHRPQDPVLFADELRNCLSAVEPRQTFRRRAPAAIPPAMATIATPRRTPGARRLALAAAIVVALIGLGLGLALPLAHSWRNQRNVAQLGVPVGVPERQAAAVAQTPAAQPETTVPSQQPTTVAQNEAPQNSVAATNAVPEPQLSPLTQPAIASNNETSAGAPAEGPNEPATAPVTQPAPQGMTRVEQQSSDSIADSSSAAPGSTTAAPANATETKSLPETSPARPRKSTPRVASTARSQHTSASTHATHGSFRAEFVGTTPDGEWIFNAPSGEARLALPPPDEGEAIETPRSRRHPRVLRALPADPEVRPALPPGE